MTPGSDSKVPFKLAAPVIPPGERDHDAVARLTRYFKALQQKSLTETAAAECERRAPYFSRLAAFLRNALENNPEWGQDSPQKRQDILHLATPEKLGGLFNAIAQETQGTILSEPAIVPTSIYRKATLAATVFNGIPHIESSLKDDPDVIFGFAQIFRTPPAGQVNTGATAPLVALDEIALENLSATGMTEILLRDLQTVMAEGTHDTIHHFSNETLSETVISKFSRFIPDNHPVREWSWKNRLGTRDDKNVLGQESYLILTHQKIQESGWGASEEEHIGAVIEHYFDALEIIATQAVGKEDEIRFRDLRTVDYFSQVMSYALLRFIPMSHPLMTICLDRMEAIDAIDPKHEKDLRLFQYDMARLVHDTNDSMKRAVDNYAAAGLTILPENDRNPDARQVKMVRLIAASPWEAHLMSPPSAQDKELQAAKNRVDTVTLDLFSATLEAYSFKP